METKMLDADKQAPAYFTLIIQMICHIKAETLPSQGHIKKTAIFRWNGLNMRNLK